MRRRRMAALAAAALLATIAAGCGGATGPVVGTAKSYAKVSGKVTVKGKSAKRGKVTFDLSNASPLAGSVRTAEVKADGSYEIEAPVGKNTAIVQGTGDPAEGTYNTAIVEVGAGGNTRDFDLPLKP